MSKASVPLNIKVMNLADQSLREMIGYVDSAREQFERLVHLFPKIGGTYAYCSFCSKKFKISNHGLRRYRHHHRREHGPL